MVSTLHANRVALERGGRLIIQDLCFSVASGQALILKGANGAGKTSLLRAIAGFLPLSAGRFDLEGSDAELDIGSQLHFIGHQNAHKASMTVQENLEFWCGYNGGSPEKTDRALVAFDLQRLAQIPASYLSAGQRRRLGLGRLLVSERTLWLLDEPTTALDAASQDALIRVCNDHIGGGGMIIAATHMPLGFENSVELQLDAIGASR